MQGWRGWGGRDHPTRAWNTVSRNNDDDNDDEKVPNGKLISSVGNGQLIRKKTVNCL